MFHDVMQENQATPPRHIGMYARDFALSAHGDQRYGEQPYKVHLDRVHRVLRSFGFGGPFWASVAWLHDVIEDTQVTLPVLQAEFGDEIAQVVWAVTGEGEERAACVASIYRKISSNWRAAVLKCADRIANMESAAESHSVKHAVMYAREYDGFCNALHTNVPAPMLERLAQAFNACAHMSGASADDRAVDSFADKLKAKLAKGRAKGRSGWRGEDAKDFLLPALHEHLEKGDPLDVALYCMFLDHHQVATA